MGINEVVFILFQIVSYCDFLIEEQREQEKVLGVASKLIYKDTMKVQNQQSIIISRRLITLILFLHWKPGVS